MTDVTMLEGEFRAEGARFAVVVSRFNSFVVENLLTGAMDALTRHGEAMARTQQAATHSGERSSCAPSGPTTSGT